MTKKLRFGMLVRISDIPKSDRSESIKTQTKQLTADVKSLGGVIVKTYSGGEHATLNSERKMLDSLLRDAAKGLFDAVICTDQSRWARDNLKSKQGLEILRQNGCRFFLRTKQFDLYNPQDRFFLGMSGEMDEYIGLLQAQKSMDNKIEIALKGGHAAGNLWYGRTYDKVAYRAGKDPAKCWGVDEERKKAVQWAMDQYLAGVPVAKLCPQMPPYAKSRPDCKKWGMSDVALTRLFRERLGNKMTYHFLSERLNIDQKITVTIPALVDDPKKIEAVQERLKFNRRFNKSQNYNHEYLLSGFVYCGKCGIALTGQTQRGHNRYYRHRKGIQGCCDPLPFHGIRADLLERLVWETIGSAFESADNLREALLAAVPGGSKAKTLDEEINLCKTKIRELERDRDTLLQKVKAGVLSDAIIKKEATTIETQLNLFTKRLETAKGRLAHLPDEKVIGNYAEMMQKVMAKYKESSNRRLSFEEKRHALEVCFSDIGTGKPGILVYGTRMNGKQGKSKLVDFEVRGSLKAVLGPLAELTENIGEKKYKNEKRIIQAFLYDQGCGKRYRPGPVHLP